MNGNHEERQTSEEVQVQTTWSTKALEVAKRRLPILTWLPNYTLSLFAQDVLAGFSVALTEIPQGIAFALIAELPTEYGLYCGFMGGFFYMIFGSCKDVNVGPTSIIALMLQSHVLKMGYDMGVLITFIAGLIILLLGVLHLGFVVEFFSYPIIAGFTSAAATTIASTQFKGLLGLSGSADGFIEVLKFIFTHITETRKWDAILGFTSIIFLVVLREIRVYGSLKHRPEWSKRRNLWAQFIFMLSLSRNALVVIIGTLLAANIRGDDGKPPFKITGDVKGGLPPFGLPPFSTTFNGTDYSFYDMMDEYNTTIIFLPLVAILEIVAIAKAFSKGKKLDATQELIALGICNIMGSFVRSMPTTGSFTRTAVNNASGVQTQLAGSITALIVILALQLITSSFYYIPKATLASVVICSMFYLFDFEAFPLLWRSKKIDMIPFLVTLLCGIFISLEYGILIGIGTNLLFILYASARPKLGLTKIADRVYLLSPKSSIQFSAAEHLRDIVLECEELDTTVVIDGKNIGNMDSTVAKILSMLNSALKLRNQTLVFINFKEEIRRTCIGIDAKLTDCFTNHNLDEIISEEPKLLNTSSTTCIV